MKLFKQWMTVCILAVIFIAGTAMGKEIPVLAAERAGDAPSDILVVYFSCTENTKAVAEHAADILNADIYEIVPKTPYTSADLNYGDSSSRTSLENRDPDARPEISGSVENMAAYGTILIGYPIWWYTAPTIIRTFLEAYDFTGKKIVLFATSGGSGLGRTAEELADSCPKADIRNGKMLNGNSSESELQKWVESL